MSSECIPDSGHFRQPKRDRLLSIVCKFEEKCRTKNVYSTVEKRIPMLKWMREYDWRESFFADLSSGLTMAVFMVPTGIAHAGICGVEPVYGLYTSIFPTFLYMIFGSSKYNALGPFAILSVLTQSTIENVQNMLTAHEMTYNSTMLNVTMDLNMTDTVIASVEKMAPVRPIHVATTVMFLSGIFHIILGLVRAEFLSCYLSEQVMSGFIVGGFIHVFFSQIGEALGIKLPPRDGPGALLFKVVDLLERLNETQIPTALISTVSLMFLSFSRKILDPWLSNVFEFPVPYELLVVVVGITATNYADLSNRHNVSVVGNIPTDFPPPAMPRFELIPSIFVTSLGITIVTVAIHLTVIKIVEFKYHEKANSGQELYALGIVSVLSSAFPVFPVTSIFARTLIGSPVKNSTQMTVCFSSLALLTVVLYIGPALEYLPKCILASIVLASLTAGFDKIRELKTLWPLFKTDLFIFIVTVVLTVCYELAKGLIISVAFAVLTTVIRNQCSAWHFLHHDSEIDEFKEVPKKALNEVNSHICIFRFDGPLIFTSAQKFDKSVRKALKKWDKRCPLESDELGFVWRTQNLSNKTALIIDCSGFPYVDYMGMVTLKRVFIDLSIANVFVCLAAPKANLRKMFESTDFYETVPVQQVFPTVKRATEVLAKNKEDLADITKLIA